MYIFKSEVTQTEADVIEALDLPFTRKEAISHVILQLRDKNGSDVGMTLLKRARRSWINSTIAGTQRDAQAYRYSVTAICECLADLYGETELFYKAMLNATGEVKLTAEQANVLYSQDSLRLGERAG